MISGKDDALWNAVSNKDLQEVKCAVSNGGNVNMVCGDSFVRREMAAQSATVGRSLLHHAAWSGNYDIFRYLVESGADINKRRFTAWHPHGGVSGRGSTPLHHAVQYNRYDIVQYLIGIGCDINVPGEQGYTALHIAAKFNYPELVRLLLSHGARTDMITRDEKTARDLAAGQQDRAHAQMGDMLALFDQYDRESRTRPRPLPLAPLTQWKGTGGMATGEGREAGGREAVAGTGADTDTSKVTEKSAVNFPQVTTRDIGGNYTKEQSASQHSEQHKYRRDQEAEATQHFVYRQSTSPQYQSASYQHATYQPSSSPELYQQPKVCGEYLQGGSGLQDRQHEQWNAYKQSISSCTHGAGVARSIDGVRLQQQQQQQEPGLIMAQNSSRIADDYDQYGQDSNRLGHAYGATNHITRQAPQSGSRSVQGYDDVISTFRRRKAPDLNCAPIPPSDPLKRGSSSNDRNDMKSLLGFGGD